MPNISHKNYWSSGLVVEGGVYWPTSNFSSRGPLLDPWEFWALVSSLNDADLWFMCVDMVTLLQVLVFQKGFKDDERRKLAIVTGQILANALCTPRVLNALFEDHLVKEGGCHCSISNCTQPAAAVSLSVDLSNMSWQLEYLSLHSHDLFCKTAEYWISVFVTGWRKSV